MAAGWPLTLAFIAALAASAGQAQAQTPVVATPATTLEGFCGEMRQLATIIEASTDDLPSCGGQNLGGYHISLAEDGATYRLTYTEKADTELVAESRDAATVMEAVFVEVTEALALRLVDAVEEIPPNPLATPKGDPRKMALKLQTMKGRKQQELLGRIDPAWGARQAARNAQRLQQIQAFFDR